MIVKLRIVSHLASLLVGLFLFAGLFFFAASASAQISFTLDDLVEIAAPLSVVEGALEDSDDAVVFAELQGFVLASELFVDADNPGAEINGAGVGGTAGSILAGTRIDSYLVHFDPVGQPTDLNVTVAWFLAFETTNDILGLIYSDGLLDDSDYLGAPGTTYPTGVDFRGTTGSSEGNDGLLWSMFTAMSGLQSVTVAVDQVRIIVATPVPEPGSILLILPALLASAMLRRRA